MIVNAKWIADAIKLSADVHDNSGKRLCLSGSQLTVPDYVAIGNCYERAKTLRGLALIIEQWEECSLEQVQR